MKRNGWISNLDVLAHPGLARGSMNVRELLCGQTLKVWKYRSANSLPRHCCRERDVRASWLSLIWGPQLQPISAAAAGVHHFSLTPWLRLWPPPLVELIASLDNASGLHLTDGAFHYTSHHTFTYRWDLLWCLARSICPVCVLFKPVKVIAAEVLSACWQFWPKKKPCKKSNFLGTLLLFNVVKWSVFVHFVSSFTGLMSLRKE